MLWVKIDRSSDVSLTRQIFEDLRSKILNKEMIAGEKLPSTRKLAMELKVSRNIIIEVYEQLIAEGYLESLEGSGTYVAKGTSLERFMNYYTYDVAYKTVKEKQNDTADVINFISGTPDLSLFPKIWWAKCMKEACLDATPDSINYTSSAGIYDLRKSISKLLLRTKGIKCEPENIVITSGTSESFLILSKFFQGKYDEAVVEDPSYTAIKNIFKYMNINLYEVPADDRGMNVEMIPDNKKSSFIVVTPSHHFPLGGVLPIQRRIKLIEYARKNNIYIVENDYDSEFRYTGYPISSLQILDADHVIHAGTFSESMYPSIRIGYLVVPPKMSRDIKIVKSYLGLSKSSIDQIALSYFIKRGYFERHLNKMKKIYFKKRESLIGSLRASFGDRAKISGDSTGLYIVVEFEGINFTDELLKKIKDYGVNLYAMDEYASAKGMYASKIIFGFGNLSIDQITEGIDRLKKALN
jgi:GntR family transcriptional regulator/MocR family aminotransferase